MGFKRDVGAILSHWQSKDQRQTLLFSATLQAEVKDVINKTLCNKYVTVDCIHDTDPAPRTNAQVNVIVPSDHRLVSSTVDILAKLILA
jgi:superfamily II DNA/RNA helicase